jgi:hypothetical protein
MARDRGSYAGVVRGDVERGAGVVCEENGCGGRVQLAPGDAWEDVTPVRVASTVGEPDALLDIILSTRVPSAVMGSLEKIVKLACKPKAAPPKAKARIHPLR